MVNGIRKLSF